VVDNDLKPLLRRAEREMWIFRIIGALILTPCVVMIWRTWSGPEDWLIILFAAFLPIYWEYDHWRYRRLLQEFKRS
jgi:hypothetical protein